MGQSETLLSRDSADWHLVVVYVEAGEEGAAAGTAHGGAHKPVLVAGPRLLQVPRQLGHELQGPQLYVLQQLIIKT